MQEIGEERLVQEDLALEEEIENNGRRQQDGGVFQRLAAGQRLEESQGEKGHQDPQQQVVAEIEAAETHQQVLDLEVERGGRQQEQDIEQRKLTTFSILFFLFFLDCRLGFLQDLGLDLLEQGAVLLEQLAHGLLPSPRRLSPSDTRAGLVYDLVRDSALDDVALLEKPRP